MRFKECSRTRISNALGNERNAGLCRVPLELTEHGLWTPRFGNYAKHSRPVSRCEDRRRQVKKAKTFDQGLRQRVRRGILLDMHGSLPLVPQQDVGAFETSALKRFNVEMYEVPPRYRTPYFAHIWGGGYASSYYAYLWSEVLDHDAYYWFVENGGLTRANGQRFRDMILSRGGTQEAASLYRAFRGVIQRRALISSAGSTAAGSGSEGRQLFATERSRVACDRGRRVCREAS